MNDYDKFDDYIKGLFDKTPKVPAELNWEEMDFDLPDAKEQKTKPNRKKYLGLLLLLLVAIVVVYFSIDKEKNAENQDPKQMTEQATDSETVSKIPQLSTEDNTKNTSAINDLQKGEKTPSSTFIDDKATLNSNTRTAKPKKRKASKSNNLEKKTPPSIANDSFPAIATDNNSQLNPINTKDDFLSDFPKNNTAQILTQTNNNVSYKSVESSSSSPITQTQSLEESIPLSIEALSTISINNLPINDEVELLPSPALSEMNYEDKTSNFRLGEVFVGYGLNNFNLKTEDSNILKNKVNRAIGNSMRVGARLRLNDNWQTNIQLKHDRYHSTFEHIRALDTTYRSDGNRLYRVYKYENTFQNNYTNTLGLQLGVERKWQVAKRLQLYAGIGFTPTYAFSVNGKTTADTVVDKLIFDNQINKFSVSGSASAGVIIPINQSINIEAAYQYNRFLLNDIFINNGIQANQQNTASLMISYRLSN